MTSNREQAEELLAKAKGTTSRDTLAAAGQGYAILALADAVEQQVAAVRSIAEGIGGVEQSNDATRYGTVVDLLGGVVQNTAGGHR